MLLLLLFYIFHIIIIVVFVYIFIPIICLLLSWLSSHCLCEHWTMWNVNGENYFHHLFFFDSNKLYCRNKLSVIFICLSFAACTSLLFFPFSSLLPLVLFITQCELCVYFYSDKCIQCALFAFKSTNISLFLYLSISLMTTNEPLPSIVMCCVCGLVTNIFSSCYSLLFSINSQLK